MPKLIKLSFYFLPEDYRMIEQLGFSLRYIHEEELKKHRHIGESLRAFEDGLKKAVDHDGSYQAEASNLTLDYQDVTYFDEIVPQIKGHPVVKEAPEPEQVALSSYTKELAHTMTYDKGENKVIFEQDGEDAEPLPLSSKEVLGYRGHEL